MSSVSNLLSGKETYEQMGDRKRNKRYKLRELHPLVKDPPSLLSKDSANDFPF